MSAAMLVAEAREMEIKLYGKRVEIAMAVGARENAEFWKDQMYAAIKARGAVVDAGCYFATEGAKAREAAT